MYGKKGDLKLPKQRIIYQGKIFELLSSFGFGWLYARDQQRLLTDKNGQPQLKFEIDPNKKIPSSTII